VSDLDVRIGAFRYDTTRALFDRDATVEGANVTVGSGATLPEVFLGLLRDDVFDVAELGLTYYLRTLEQDAQYVAIPAFPNRVFRHSCVFINRRSITGPADLVDKTIGEFGVYGQDSGVWARGILMDEYGFRPERNRWVIGGLNQPSPPLDFITQIRPPGIDITAAPTDRSLNQMLTEGEIDALFSANVPQCILDAEPEVGLLFPDYEQRERDFFRRTGIFPIMHTVAARRELTDAHPGLATKIYDTFLQAKDIAAERYRQGRQLFEVPTMVPWMNALFEENRALFPDDWWPYGIEANRSALETYLRYHYEQGLSERHWTIEEIFVTELAHT
jgi:hypothetical protein